MVALVTINSFQWVIPAFQDIRNRMHRIILSEQTLALMHISTSSHLAKQQRGKITSTNTDVWKYVRARFLGRPSSRAQRRTMWLNRRYKSFAPIFLDEMKPRVQLVKSALEPIDIPSTHLPEVAFAGRSNCGKSTLLNELTGRHCIAAVNKLPGSTQEVNFYKVGSPPSLVMVDLPGYGFAFATEEKRLQWTEFMLYYLKARVNLKRVLLLIDSRQGLKISDKEMLAYFERHHIKWQIILTKADLVHERSLCRQIPLIQHELNPFRYQIHPIIPLSALWKQGLDDLRKELTSLRKDRTASPIDTQLQQDNEKYLPTNSCTVSPPPEKKMKRKPIVDSNKFPSAVDSQRSLPSLQEVVQVALSKWNITDVVRHNRNEEMLSRFTTKNADEMPPMKGEDPFAPAKATLVEFDMEHPIEASGSVIPTNTHSINCLETKTSFLNSEETFVHISEKLSKRISSKPTSRDYPPLENLNKGELSEASLGSFTTSFDMEMLEETPHSLEEASTLRKDLPFLSEKPSSSSLVLHKYNDQKRSRLLQSEDFIEVSEKRDEIKSGLLGILPHNSMDYSFKQAADHKLSPFLTNMKRALDRKQRYQLENLDSYSLVHDISRKNTTNTLFAARHPDTLSKGNKSNASSVKQGSNQTNTFIKGTKRWTLLGKPRSKKRLNIPKKDIATLFQLKEDSNPLHSKDNWKQLRQKYARWQKKHSNITRYSRPPTKEEVTGVTMRNLGRKLISSTERKQANAFSYGSGESRLSERKKNSPTLFNTMGKNRITDRYNPSRHQYLEWQNTQHATSFENSQKHKKKKSYAK